MPRYWFRQKISGYGSTPNTWQGWLFLVIVLALVFGLMVGTKYVIADPVLQRWVKGGGMIVLAVVSLWIALAKTRPE